MNRAAPSCWPRARPYLPVSRGEVLQGPGGALQGGGVGAFSQQVEVRLHHHRVPQQLRPSQGLGEARDRPDAVPLRQKPIRKSRRGPSALTHQQQTRQSRSYLGVGPAAPLPAAPPLAPAEVVQLLARGGEPQQGVQLLVAEETGGGHLHLQAVREVPQGAHAVLHNLKRENRRNFHSLFSTLLRFLSIKPDGGARGSYS